MGGKRTELTEVVLEVEEGVDVRVQGKNIALRKTRLRRIGIRGTFIVS